MEFTTKFSAGTLQEVRRASRRWPYWPVQFVGSFRMLAFVIGTLAFAIRSFYVGVSATPVDRDNLVTSGILFALIAIFLCILALRENAQARKDAKSHEPIRLLFDSKGFSFAQFSVSIRQYQWDQFSDFTFGKRILLFSVKNRKARVAVPWIHSHP